MNYPDLQASLIALISDSSKIEDTLLKICQKLNKSADKFTWTGFYFMNHQNKVLNLGPYVGKPTDHIKIPFGKGICGQVADSGKTYLAEDVLAEGNYIACSLDVRSEIVIPIYHNKLLVGQLDIDSKEINAFSEKDRLMLETLCLELGKQRGTELEALALELA